MLSIFKTTGFTLLAREIIFDENSDTPIKIKGDKIGLFAWLLKKLKLKDPSTTLITEGNSLIVESGGKSFSHFPLQLAHHYAIRYAQRKLLLVIALIFSVIACLITLSALGELFDGHFQGFLIVLCMALFSAGIGYLCYRLYLRSGSLQWQMGFYNHSGSVSIRVKSGQTGTMVTSEQLDSARKATKAVVTKHSNYFN